MGQLSENKGESTLASDEELYGLYRKTSDSGCLTELVDRYREELTFFIYGYVKNMEDAEDIMLEAFSIAATERARFSGKSSFKTWLFAIGRNQGLKLLRRNRKTLPLNEEIVSSGAAPDVQILKDERNALLYEALGQISPEYRQALHLTYFEGMTGDEVATVMDKSKKQIYNLISRGKQACREALVKLGYEHE
ncbi:MAG: sigma-70 family RNA polymerase sigma factor [Lachnospiraceae bacterium]|nr:sigma-70 family RNA polymerase sigma factor [Lachnospiraceae bacterium]